MQKSIVVGELQWIFVFIYEELNSYNKINFYNGEKCGILNISICELTGVY